MTLWVTWRILQHPIRIWSLAVGIFLVTRSSAHHVLPAVLRSSCILTHLRLIVTQGMDSVIGSILSSFYIWGGEGRRMRNLPELTSQNVASPPAVLWCIIWLMTGGAHKEGEFLTILLSLLGNSTLLPCIFGFPSSWEFRHQSARMENIH